MNYSMRTIFDFDALMGSGNFDRSISVGMNKKGHEKSLEFSHDFGDGESYFFEVAGAFCLNVLVDLEGTIFRIDLDLDDNSIARFKGRDTVLETSHEVDFLSLLEFFERNEYAWRFQKEATYLQTVGVRLDKNVIVFYHFGSKEDNDFGLGKLVSFLPGHPLNVCK